MDFKSLWLLNLTDDQRSTATAMRAAIQEALNEMLGADSKIEKLSSQQDDLKAKGAALSERVDVSNLAAVAEVSTLKTALDLVSNRLQELVESHHAPATKLQAELRAVDTLHESVMKPQYKATEAYVANTIDLFMAQPGQGLSLARATDLVVSLGMNCGRAWGRRADVISEARECLAWLDAILNGYSPFAWPPAK